MKQVVLFGVGSRLCFEYEESCQRAGTEILFGIRNMDVPVMCSDRIGLRTLSELDAADRARAFLVPLFTPRHRKTACDHAGTLGFAAPATLIDPTAILASTVRIGAGSYVNAGTVLGAETCLGEWVVINRGSAIGHHVRFGDFASVGPGCTLCGDVQVGKAAMIGAGSVILPGISIGAGSVVAAGSVVTRDLPAHTKLIDRARTPRMEALDAPIDD